MGQPLQTNSTKFVRIVTLNCFEHNSDNGIMQNKQRAHYPVRTRNDSDGKVLATSEQVNHKTLLLLAKETTTHLCPVILEGSSQPPN
jgi:hypothetical protein